MITSTGNAQVKNLIQLQKKAKVRREQGLYIVEGVRMFREAPGQLIRQIYVSESFEKAAGHKELLARRKYEVLSDTVFARVSDTQTPQGILCVMRMPEYDLANLLSRTQVFAMDSAALRSGGEKQGQSLEINFKKNARHNQPETKDADQINKIFVEKKAWAAKTNESIGIWLVLENIQDPGNLGTMFRTGEGAGITGIIMDRNTVDIFNPKTIRSTMGSIFRVPFVITETLSDAIAQLKAHQVQVYAAHLGGKVCYDEPDYTRASAFLIGNEGNGLTKETALLADTFLRIPMGGQLESLNAAMAAGILMYEANRQRRQK